MALKKAQLAPLVHVGLSGQRRLSISRGECSTDRATPRMLDGPIF